MRSKWIVTARVEKHQIDALFGLHLREMFFTIGPEP